MCILLMQFCTAIALLRCALWIVEALLFMNTAIKNRRKAKKKG
jgi:hypothetical protein